MNIDILKDGLKIHSVLSDRDENIKVKITIETIKILYLEEGM